MITSRSTTSGGATTTLTSSCSITSSRGTDDSEEDARRKRFPADKAYYVAKELLMTERTYKKDLEVITVVTTAFNFLRTLVLLHPPRLVFDFWCAGFQGQIGSPRLCASSPAHETTQVFELPSTLSHIFGCVHFNSELGTPLSFRQPRCEFIVKGSYCLVVR